MLLETPRLILREFKRDDWPFVHEYACDPEVSYFMTWGPNSKEETAGYVERVIKYAGEVPRRMYEVAVINKEEKKLIGACALRVMNPEHLAAEIAYCFNKDYWRRGYASEASRGLIRFGFDTLGMHRIYGLCDVENIGSAGVMTGIGMKQEGRLRDFNLVKGRWRDFYIYSILVNEWEPDCGG